MTCRPNHRGRSLAGLAVLTFLTPLAHAIDAVVLEVREMTVAGLPVKGASVRLDLPGVDPNDVHVQAEGNLLTISGERKSDQSGPDYRETYYGKFERAVSLPQGVETDKITARYEHGVLEIKVPLPAELAGRKIPIQIEQKENRKLEAKAA